MNLLKLFPRYTLTCLTIAIVTTLCLMPIEDPPLAEVPFIDKWTHVVLFGGICAVMIIEMTLSRHLAQRWMAPVVTSLYGGLIELMQDRLTTYRSGEWLDFWADTIGAFAAFLISICVLRLLKRCQHRF